jgi:hypothetical protein
LPIRRVSIKNYRSITAADLKLGDVTVVIGPSDSGKSNLVRALRDWAFNAVGDGMISAGSTVARVAVALDSGTVVAWERRGEHYDRRSGGSSYYVRARGQTIEHQKIGHGVPAEISETTGIRELVVDDDRVRVQFAEQADPWFLLANPPWTPGKVTKVVGKIAGLDGLILANRTLERERQGEEGEGRRLALAIADQRRALGEYAGLDRALALCARAEEAFRAIEAKRERIGEAKEILARLKARKEEVARQRELAARLRPALARAAELRLPEFLDRLASARDALAALERLEERVGGAKQRVVAAKQALAVAREGVESVATGEFECPLCGGAAHAECRARLAAEAKA